MKLKRIDGRPNELKFKAEDGTVYILRKKDFRRFNHSPEYYLMKEAEPKNLYLSGVFKTERAGVLSLDLIDEIGMRVKHTLTINGDTAELTKE